MLSLAGGAELTRHAENDRPTDGPVETLSYRLQLAELQRAAEAQEQVDRGERTEPDTGTERVSRAEQAEASPEPEPEPEPASGSDSGSSSESAPSEPAGPVPGSCSEYSGNRATGCTLLVEAGFSIGNMSCLDSLWERESGWNHTARNPSSGAYGIPQALPADKMASHGSDWQTNPATQIRWGLDYIDNRYGTPCGAWSFWQANNWY